MYMDPYTASGNPAIDPSLPRHSSGSPNLVDSNDKQIQNQPELAEDENEEESNFGEIGMFGDFCLMCGEMIDGEVFDGSAYCSEECEYHQRITSESDWCDLSLEGYQLPSYGCSTAVSSARTSPLNSPNLQASGRLAILCSGPPPCELLLPLDLGERLLGAKAVAERYLENRPKSWQEEGEETEEGKMKKKKKEDVEERISGADEGVEEAGDRKRAGAGQSSSSLHSSTITPSQKPLVSTGSHLKSRPALAQLSDLEDFWGPPSKQTASTSRPASPHSLASIDPPLPSSSTVNPNSGQTLSSSRRRVSEPVFSHSQPIEVSPSNPHLYHSSFSLTSLSSLSPSSSQECAQSCCSTHFV
ncbi:uncharacterized protein PGTG_01178 [Puccinia graminis f. sp. tritici CRL 75-36-700-3]|uniref:Uncharacterized protein n=1 Tax=Puccinia graminis f. sp. tritici (strain CRL 75-36-700-3 / race SCCL) TaxID=418459 RepID=E3JUX2_PUCGT|nr:uncharacterized protein PGTG_01178 [Puccinia graminis f. sp. tritici CRL 75-36-700-3]EFP75847.1 hypothetical protein PGTG_01178 [Puccinia graminis f. sp. tritici CRL 75-36-700-3]